MIGHFPATLLIPGLLFLAAGFLNRARARSMDRESPGGVQLVASTLKSANLTIILGIVLLAIAIPLALVIRGMS
jgi:hypothetical protein